MKTIKNLALLLVLVLASCKNDVQPEVKTIAMEDSANAVATTLDQNATYAKVEFSIDGMTCAMGCAKTIENKMAKMEGVKSAKVDFDSRLAMVEYDEAKVSPKNLEEAVAKVGEVYKVKDMKTVAAFSSETKTCKADCKMACCADKTAEEKAACTKDCNKTCCTAEKKAE